MSYNLFLDDERDPLQCTWVYKIFEYDWVIVRSYDEAVAYVENFGFPKIVSFDHDLGTEKTGYDFVKWLVELDLETNTMPVKFNYLVHSKNPVGKESIDNYLKNYLTVRASNFK